MKSLTSLWSCMADELAIRCHTSAARDKQTVTSRTEHEGLSFLAITLADLGKATQKWLDQGFVVPSDVPAFARGPKRLTGLPSFMSGFLGRVFDPASGVLYEHPDTEAIYAILQLTLLFSKIALPEDPLRESSARPGKPVKVVSPARERLAMSEYVICEQDVKDADARLDPDYLSDFKRMSAMLFGELFSKVDRDVYWGRIVPKHGPGAVAERLTANGKYNQRTWTSRLQRVFPAEGFVIPNGRYTSRLKGNEFTILEPGSEIPVRVITVPKTLKTPRVIAIEPVAQQYVQQGLYRAILSAMQEDGFLSRVIGFRDQEPNRQMACEGSLSGELATLDLSEASDRVSNQHVLAMMEDWPHLSAAVQATRSRKADVPGFGVIRFAKFASMGSALCFPVEAMVFLTMIFLGIERELSTPLSRRKLKKLFSRRVRVFGDDLIVPRDYVLSVVSELETFGFRVNAGKSFWTGRFRESCGRMYFDGQDVSIVKVRQVLPTRRQSASEIISASEFRNLAYWAGLWKTAAWMDDLMGNLLKRYPNVGRKSSLLGRETALGYEYSTLDPHTFSPITKGYYKVGEPPVDRLDGIGALTKCLLQGHPSLGSFALDLGDVHPVDDLLPKVETDHLERFGRPKHVGIKLGWRSPY